MWDLWWQSGCGTDFLLTVFSSLVSLIPPILYTFTSHSRRYVISTTDSLVISTENKQTTQNNAAQVAQRKYFLKEGSASLWTCNNMARYVLPLTSNVGSKKDFGLKCFYIWIIIIIIIIIIIMMIILPVTWQTICGERKISGVLM